MHTTVRSDTQAVSIQAPPDAVLDFVGDPRNLPRWAPDFARAVRAEADHWVVDSGGEELRVRIPVSRERGTVDFLRLTSAQGAYARVVSNGGGSELMFTQFFPDAMSEADVERRRAVVAQELRTVQALCEVRGVS
jgi:hypothetical protein